MTVHSIAEGRRTPELEAAPFVREFAPAIRSALLEDARTQTFQKGERIHRAGEIPDRLCVVLSGMVELCGTMRDPGCGVLMLAHGDLIFPMAVLHREPCLTSVTALTRSRLLMLSGKVVERQAVSQPEVGAALARVMGAQWRMAVRHIIDLKSRSAAERLTAFLLKFVDYSEDEIVELPFTKTTLAARVGVSRETLSRIIQVVAANGIVLRGSQIVVRDRRKAEKFCGPEPYVRRSERALDVYAF
jgi:CRP-like cAMP-binding protein